MTTLREIAEDAALAEMVGREFAKIPRPDPIAPELDPESPHTHSAMTIAQVVAAIACLVAGVYPFA